MGSKFREKRLFRAGLAGLILLVLVAGGFLLVNKGLPGMLTLWIAGALREHQIEPAPVRVEHVGPTTAVLAPGSVGMENQSLSWESLEVRYSPLNLLSGTLDHVSLQDPHLSFIWPIRAMPPAEAQTPSVESPPATPSQPPPAIESRPDLPKQQAVPPMPELPSLIPSYHKVADFLEDLPFTRFSADSGKFTVGSGDLPELSGKWQAFFLQEADLVSGNVLIETESASLISTVSGIRSAKAISIHNDLTLQPEFFAELRQRFPGRSPSSFPDPREPLTGEVLLDWTGPGPPSVSAEVSLDAFEWKPLSGIELGSTALMAIATFKDGVLRLNAGCRVNRLSWKGVAVSSFGVRTSFTSGERLRVESERFTLSAPGWNGLFAFRGSAPLPEIGDSLVQGQLELAFSSLEGPSFSVEPASLLLRLKESLSVQASPLGLKRRTTLWVEDLSIETDLQLSGLSGGLTWYNSVGAHMGSVNFNGAFPVSGAFSPDFLFKDSSGQPFLDGSLTLGGDAVNLEARGELPVAWLNALNEWAGWVPGRLTGASPMVEASLSNMSVFPRGRVLLSIAGGAFAKDQGLSIEGINGALPLEFIGLPRTRSQQTLTIDTLKAGGLTIENIRLDWSLPTVRTLRIEELEGRLGGGTVRVNPFTVDPLDHEVDMDIHFSQVEAGLLLNWYGEDRFAIEGTLSGKLDLQWREGTWIVGKGGMRIDNSYTDARFVFTDEAFLREQFAGLDAVPSDLREPLLSALLKKGIRIDQLELELELVPDGKTVSLKLTLAGETVSDEIEVPIEGLVINNLIPRDDLARLLGLFGPVRFLDAP